MSAREDRGPRARFVRGFTLIEMMISVAIVGILAAIAIPNFQRYQLKVKTTEARTLMGAIVTCQEAYVAEYENYGNITAMNPPGQPAIEKRVWPTIPCPTTCNRKAPASCNSFSCIGFEPPANVYYSYVAPHRIASQADPAEWGGAALADLDGDGQNGSFAYRTQNGGGGLGFVYDGISACPANITATTLENCTPTAF